jgi:hypothetical protein
MVCFSFPDSVCKHLQICCPLCVMLSNFNFNGHVIFVEIPLGRVSLELSFQGGDCFCWVKCGLTNFDCKHRGSLRFIRNGSL